MLLFWRIRYLDRRDKQFKDRDLWLNTNSLDPLTKGAIEATYDMTGGSGRELLRYRHLFQQKERPTGDSFDRAGGVFIHDYFEDEDSLELTLKQMAVVLTGNPEAVFFPPGTREHDAEFFLAPKPPIDLRQITLSADQLTILGYFVRDLRELLTTALYKNGPGSLSGYPGGPKILKTAVSDEEIRSFVTIFRRLYMETEPANFTKAAAVFSDVLTGQPIGQWVQATANEYEACMKEKVESTPMIGQRRLTFSRKRLIDVFLYTRYAHQPDDRRARQFNECLAEVGGGNPVLTWLFLTEVWKSALEIGNAGRVIADFYDGYCQCHSIPCQVLASVHTDNPGIGALEKKEAQESRVLREKAEEVAKAMWESAGRPEGGVMAFINQALERLRAATGRTNCGRV
jgi:hypothetical protein